MTRRISIKAAAAVAAALAVSAIASPSAAMLDVPFYNYTYFSDATYTTVVGYETGTCFHGQAAVHQMVGTGSAYMLQERAGVCRGDLTIYE
ncbi:hypothetical protein [Brevundimonas sp.]|uniref:hypothetical protein n=1 Tax=Brevundimonas sp. TaxID=1871086 RepID=UPI003F70DED7